MFAKVLVLALLGSSLVLADLPGSKTITKEQIKQQWTKNLDEVVRKFDERLSKTSNKAESKLDKILTALKGKNDTAVKIAEEKMALLKTEFAELTKVLRQQLEVTITTIMSEIEKVEGDLTWLQYLELKLKLKLILIDDKIKTKAQLKIWKEKAEDVRDEAKEALKAIESEEILKKLELKYGKIYEANKEKLVQLKDKYLEVKKQAKIAIEQKKLQFEKLLLEAKDEPGKYWRLKIQARIEIAAEKIKYKLQKKQIELEVREIIWKMEIEQNQQKN